MAAPVCCRGLRPLVLSWSRELPCVWRALHTSAVCAKNRAARVRVGKGDKPVTYEQAHAPHHIAHRKGWLSLHTELFVEHPLFANTCEGHKDEKTRVTAFQGHLFQQGKQEANRQLQDEAGQAQPQNRQDGQTVTLAMMCVAQVQNYHVEWRRGARRAAALTTRDPWEGSSQRGTPHGLQPGYC
ncbi:28S ribosomal protein S24, mitochondrial isoform X4 [Balaenoptera acutorostrata]|uniref:28S ribosomal protein S24, mitochondrial isoform X4 n=1 Tax=Balaenoptera acutorostrata TaxID=9767 RepID=A0ABM3TV35_BALAC|nr:28S ribosomal protein S24, mitochondrial isoform X4 [Balaenoptera acutorostrata]